MARALLVCLVDDSADFRTLAQVVFTRFLPTISLRLYESGQVLLDDLPPMQPLPNLIILDQHMPGLTGHQTLLGLKRQDAFKPIPVVMMSADVSHSETNRAFNAGARSFIEKPTLISFESSSSKPVNTRVGLLTNPSTSIGYSWKQNRLSSIRR